MSTITAIDCVVSTPPPVVTFDGGPADASGSCASVAQAYPGDTVTPTPISSTTNVTTTTTTSTTVPMSSQPAPGSPGACGPPGYAGCSGGGLNCGSGIAGSCDGVTTGTPSVATVPVVAAQPQQPLAFTGAGLELTGGLGLLLCVVGALIVRRVQNLT